MSACHGRDTGFTSKSIERTLKRYCRSLPEAQLLTRRLLRYCARSLRAFIESHYHRYTGQFSRAGRVLHSPAQSATTMAYPCGAPPPPLGAQAARRGHIGPIGPIRPYQISVRGAAGGAQTGGAYGVPHLDRISSTSPGRLARPRRCGTASALRTALTGLNIVPD